MYVYIDFSTFNVFENAIKKFRILENSQDTFKFWILEKQFANRKQPTNVSNNNSSMIKIIIENIFSLADTVFLLSGYKSQTCW